MGVVVMWLVIVSIRSNMSAMPNWLCNDEGVFLEGELMVDSARSDLRERLKVALTEGIEFGQGSLELVCVSVPSSCSFGEDCETDLDWHLNKPG